MKVKSKGGVELTDSNKRFCEEYIFDFNASRAYRVAYPESSPEAARSSASELLTKSNIQDYIAEIQLDLERIAGISRLMIVREHQKLAFSSIAHLHETWITRKEFESLTDEQKASIAEISTQTRFEKNAEEKVEQVDYVKIKLYDKQKSLDSLSKMMGYEAPKKIEQVSTVKSYEIVPASGKRASSK